MLVGGFEQEEGVWEVKRQFLLKENGRNENWFRAKAILRNRSSMDQGFVEICQALNLDR